MISVIIPAYNSANFIEKAIQSVLNQTYQEFELIIVDDCSTDNTEEIINKYNDLTTKIKLIKNDKNLGVGISRKIGINHATGDYITFIDADDYILEDFLEKSLTLIKEHNSDVLYTAVGILLPNNQKHIVQVGNYFAQNEATLNIFFWCQMNFITGKLYKTELLKTCKWSERRVAEDVQTLFYIMYEAQTARAFPYVGYIHVCREGSLMSYNSQKMNEIETLKHSFHNFCYNCIAEKEMLEFLMEKKDLTLLQPMYDSYYKKVAQTREYIKNQTLPQEIYLENKYLWDEVDNFYPKEN